MHVTLPLLATVQTVQTTQGLELKAVQHRREGDADVYEVASNTPGVAARFTVRPKWLGLRNDIQAHDSQQNLIAHTGCWRIFRYELSCTDEATGITTTVDRDKGTVSVSAPWREKKTAMQAGPHIDRTCRMLQSVKADGTIVARFNVRYQHDELEPNLDSGRISIVRNYNHQEDYTEVVIPPQGRPEARQVHKEWRQAPVVTPLRCHLEPGGALVIQGQDAVPQSFDLFISPGRLVTS